MLNIALKLLVKNPHPHLYFHKWGLQSKNRLKLGHNPSLSHTKVRNCQYCKRKGNRYIYGYFEHFLFPKTSQTQSKALLSFPKLRKPKILIQNWLKSAIPFSFQYNCCCIRCHNVFMSQIKLFHEIIQQNNGFTEEAVNHSPHAKDLVVWRVTLDTTFTISILLNFCHDWLINSLLSLFLQRRNGSSLCLQNRGQGCLFLKCIYVFTWYLAQVTNRMGNKSQGRTEHYNAQNTTPFDC